MDGTSMTKEWSVLDILVVRMSARVEQNCKA